MREIILATLLLTGCATTPPKCVGGYYRSYIFVPSFGWSSGASMMRPVFGWAPCKEKEGGQEHKATSSKHESTSRMV